MAYFSGAPERALNALCASIDPAAAARLSFKRSFDSEVGLSASQFSTKQRILGAAEALFAQHGFAGASLRQVTAAANVNLAAVNYHFGSKDNLIEAVFRRRLDALNARRHAALAKVEIKPDATLEDALDAFIRPALELALDRRGGAAFMR
ncbi:transcriptional regulator TetR family, partial [mine drainage metagenome]